MKLNDALGGLLTYKLAGEDAVSVTLVLEGDGLLRMPAKCPRGG